MRPLLFQTTDPYEHLAMLVETSRTTREFCRRHGLAYESYVGLKRGYWNWHATYNRIAMFNELLDRGFRGWAIYVDPNAYIAEMDFDILGYLEGKSEFAAVMTPSRAAPNFWDIDAGVLLFNLLRPTARFMIQEWLRRLETIPDAILMQAQTPIPGANGQALLQRLLAEHRHLWPEIYLESPKLMNSDDGSFIRQPLRAAATSLPERTRDVAVAIDRILGQTPTGSGQQAAWEIAVSALYRGILGRAPDKSGVSHCLSTMEQRGFGAGLEVVARQLLGSSEYQRSLESSKAVE
jgi:hypothetical protein